MKPLLPKSASSSALAARESMARLGIPDSPQNFAVWYSYHSGTHPHLNRTIDVLLSNHRGFTDQTNSEIYEHFLGATREQQIIRETAERMSAALEALDRFVNEADASVTLSHKTLQDLAKQVVGGRPLTELLNTLITETKVIEEHSRLLQDRLAKSSATIDDLRRDFEDAQRISLTDGLTGIGNRKSFDDSLRDAVMQIMETGGDLSLLLIDIDYFKTFNDTWGHQTGDEVLRAVAACIGREVADLGTAMRYGGEEFAAILPNVGLEQAILIGDRARRSVETGSFIQPETGRNVGTITVSIGAALFELGEPITSFIGRADVALYEAKENGRNAVVAA